MSFDLIQIHAVIAMAAVGNDEVRSRLNNPVEAVVDRIRVASPTWETAPRGVSLLASDQMLLPLVRLPQLRFAQPEDPGAN
jgi:hypothetical protein